jgi:hypothetical protein
MKCSKFENIAEAIQILTRSYKGSHRALKCKVLGVSSRGRLPSHLPILRWSTQAHELATAIIVLGHLLYTQLNPQAKLEQLYSKSYPLTWPYTVDS